MKGIAIVLMLIISHLCGCNRLPAKKITGSVAFEGKGDGCGDLCMYKFNSDSTMSLYVYMNKVNLKLSTHKKIFDLNNYNDDIRVVVTRYDKSASNNFCSDFPVKPNARVLQSWTAQTGTLGIALSSDKEGNSYTVEASLDSMLLVDKISNARISIPHIAFSDVHAGWFPG